MNAADDAVRADLAARPPRRRLLTTGAAAGGAVLGAAATVAVDRARGGAEPRANAPAALHGGERVPFHGAHQAGIETPAPAHATFLALDLHRGTTRDDVVRLLTVLTDDAARLTQGRGALADTEPELADAPASLTVTVGFGPELLRAAQRPVPPWLGPLPAFTIDRLEPQLCDGDLVLQIAGDDPLTVSHAARVLLRDSRTFADLRWSQKGFRRAHGAERPGTTMRNVFGQLDGSANAVPGSDHFASVVWIPDGPFAGGTSMVVRRIAMDLDTWDELDRSGRELAVGRRLDTGAPLTGTRESDPGDFSRTDEHGFAVIPEFSHMRRARGEAGSTEQIYRRAYTYDEPVQAGETSVSRAGQVFVAFQASVTEQFVPIQRRLDELDLLNQWTSPIGSAVFAVPPGCAEGEFVGESVLG